MGAATAGTVGNLQATALVISKRIYIHIYTYLHTYLHNLGATLQIYLDAGILSMMSGEDPGRLGWREQLAPLQEER